MMIVRQPQPPSGVEAAGRFVGQSVKRVEDRRLVAGAGQYVDDVRLPGMLHVAFLRSDLARARIRCLDTSAAAGSAGVPFTAARVLGIGEHQVRVHMGDVGGAFGQKVYSGREEMAVLLAARDLQPLTPDAILAAIASAMT